jgi:hypothetical protein
LHIFVNACTCIAIAVAFSSCCCQTTLVGTTDARTACCPVVAPSAASSPSSVQQATNQKKILLDLSVVKYRVDYKSSLYCTVESSSPLKRLISSNEYHYLTMDLRPHRRFSLAITQLTPNGRSASHLLINNLLIINNTFAITKRVPLYDNQYR